MSPRTARRLAWSLWILTMAFMAGMLFLTFLNVGVRADLLFGVLAILMTLGYSTDGALIAARHPRNPIGWLFLLIAFAFVMAGALDNYLTLAETRSEQLPGIAVAAWFMPLAFGLALVPIPVVLLLFPTGRLPSPRWRPVGWLMIGAPVLALAGAIIRPGFLQGELYRVPNPTGVEALRTLSGVLMTVGGIGSILMAFACVAAVVVRFRRSRGDERQQMRWLAYVGIAAAGFLALSFVSQFFYGDPNPVSEALFLAFFAMLALGIPGASAVAILKYRLYDLDVVIKKTVVAGLLGAFITVAYIIVTLGIPSLLFGVGGGARNTIPFLAAVVLALAFQPVRRAARRLADRLVYGKRATPYEVLSEFSERMGETYAVEDVLPRMARTIAEGTGAERAEVWLRVGGDLRREGTWPEGGGALSVPLDGQDIPPLSDVDLALPVRDRGELLGAIAVAMPRNEPLTTAGEKLVHDLAAQAGLVLRNARLIEELRASRKRLVAAQDEERRRLERNIHDGAQQQLVALAVRLKLAQGLVSKKAPDVAELLGSINQDAQQALEDLRDLARGIYPPLLADKGLAVALKTQARKSAIPVEIDPDGVGRYTADAEAAVYFCVLEALQNAAKYSEASRVEVRLEAANGELRFEVSDDGTGFDPATARAGAGLTNMRDRLEALGGSLSISSGPDRGTTLTGTVPTGSPG